MWVVFSSCSAWVFQCHRFSHCGAHALEHMGSIVGVHRFSCSLHVGSSQTRGQTCDSCVGRWVLYPWAIKEALSLSLGALSYHQETFVSGFTALAVNYMYKCISLSPVVFCFHSPDVYSMK